MARRGSVVCRFCDWRVQLAAILVACVLVFLCKLVPGKEECEDFDYIWREDRGLVVDDGNATRVVEPPDKCEELLAEFWVLYYAIALVLFFLVRPYLVNCTLGVSQDCSMGVPVDQSSAVATDQNQKSGNPELAEPLIKDDELAYSAHTNGDEEQPRGERLSV